MARLLHVVNHLSRKGIHRACASMRAATVTSTALICPLLLAHGAYAAPEGGVVAHGAAAIAQNGNVTTITQSTDRAVLDWQKFNLSKDESARFLQPGTNSVTVNRIHDVAPSEIHGQLSANGTVILANLNGVMFGADARVDVGGLIASTATPTARDAKDWADGKRADLPLSVAGNAEAKISNAGTITARDAGLIGLVAPTVENSGIIRATKGRVQLASGDTATLDLYGDGLVALAVKDTTTKQLINQRGLIEADGGTVLLTAAAGQTVANGVINVSGTIQARSVDGKHGKIILRADGRTAVAGNIATTKGKKTGTSKITVSGTLDVSGHTPNAKAGAITLTADHITLTSAAWLDAAGGAGGGTVNIGGEYQGKGTLGTAEFVTVEKGAVINADATNAGDGGRVIVWADNTTYFDGNILARGGLISGNGGFVETSGKENLKIVHGLADLRASHGRVGTWLLDPTDITISNRSGGAGDGTNSFSTLQLETMSAGADVALSATNDITLDFTGDTLTLANNRSLSLTAGHDITSSSAGQITVSGTGNITLTAGANLLLTNMPLNATGSGTIQLTGNNFVRTSSVTMGTGNLTIIADDLDATGALSGSGVLTIKPYSQIRSISLNYGTDGLALSTQEIAYLQNGWDHIVIGRDDASTDAGNSTGHMRFGTTTWSTDVVFATNFARALYGPLTMTNGASITFLNGWTDLLQDITTNGGNVTFAANTANAAAGGHSAGKLFMIGHTLATHGGDVTLLELVLSNTANAIDTRGSSSDGSITLSKGISHNWNSTDSTLTLNAGNNDIAFGDTVNGFEQSSGRQLNITANARSFSFNGAWGTDTLWNGDAINLGQITLTSTNTDIQLPDLKTRDNVVLNAGTGTIKAKAITTGAGDLTLTADDVELTDQLTGDGTLSFRQFTNGRMIRLNFYNGDFNLDTTELGYLHDGWEKITFGRTTMNGGVAVGNTNWKDPVLFNAGSYSTVTLYGLLNGTGNASFEFDAENRFWTDAAITTQGGDVIFGPSGSRETVLWDIGNGLPITTNGGDIIFNHQLSQNSNTAGQNIVLNAGTGTVHFGSNVDLAANLAITAATITTNGAWGATTRLGSVALNSTNTLALPSIRAGSILARTTGATADITAASGTVLSASGTGNAIVVAAARNLINNAGSGLLALTGGASARWLVYSTNPADNTLGGLASDFRRYHCGYAAGGACAAGATLIPTSGNGLIYSYAPALVATPNVLNLVYGAAAPSLSGYGYTLSGYLTGDTGDVITGSLNGSTGYTLGSNAGNYGINHSSGTLASQMGYSITYANRADAIQVARKTLSIAVSAGQTKVAGTVDPIFGYSYSGLVAGDISASFTGALSRAAGESAGNYAINQGNLAATGNYMIGGFTGGDFTITASTLAPMNEVIKRANAIIDPLRTQNFITTGVIARMEPQTMVESPADSMMADNTLPSLDRLGQDAAVPLSGRIVYVTHALQKMLK